MTTETTCNDTTELERALAHYERQLSEMPERIEQARKLSAQKTTDYERALERYGARSAVSRRASAAEARAYDAFEGAHVRVLWLEQQIELTKRAIEGRKAR